MNGSVPFSWRIKRSASATASSAIANKLLTMKVFVLIALVAAVAADSPVYRNKPYAEPAKYEAKEVYEKPTEPPKPYNFGYNVKDAEKYTDYQRQEASDGKVVQGSYRVALPDGRIQTVKYVAGEEGTVAEVTYEGEAWYPPEPEVKPAYQKDVYSKPVEYKQSEYAQTAPVYKQSEYAQPPVYQAKKY